MEKVVQSSGFCYPWAHHGIAIMAVVVVFGVETCPLSMKLLFPDVFLFVDDKWLSIMVHACHIFFTSVGITWRS